VKKVVREKSPFNIKLKNAVNIETQ
jgi:hypothetical protein